jgi:hypothetical protein
MSTDTIIEIIRRIEAGKAAAHVVPVHATFLEVTRMSGNENEAKEELERLLSEGTIQAGDTINDRYVRVAGEDYQKTVSTFIQ